MKQVVNDSLTVFVKYVHKSCNLDESIDVGLVVFRRSDVKCFLSPQESRLYCLEYGLHRCSKVSQVKFIGSIVGFLIWTLGFHRCMRKPYAKENVWNYLKNC